MLNHLFVCEYILREPKTKFSKMTKLPLSTTDGSTLPASDCSIKTDDDADHVYVLMTDK